MGTSVPGGTYPSQPSVYSPPPAAAAAPDVAMYQNAGSSLSQVPNYTLTSALPQPPPPQQPYSPKALL
ncbi:hypothetical protein J1605_009865 [Eschrichtius robustus]|nr:hypothetical protein J1605_009865 [Eschrichtius robustus]